MLYAFHVEVTFLCFMKLKRAFFSMHVKIDFETIFLRTENAALAVSYFSSDKNNLLTTQEQLKICHSSEMTDVAIDASVRSLTLRECRRVSRTGINKAVGEDIEVHCI